jgi:hypothetical protein
MLKLFLSKTSTQCRVILEGRMVGTGITKLGTVCARLKSELKGRALIIDIKDVMLISQEGENALLQLINRGAKFRPDGALAKLILQQLAHRSKKKLSDLIDGSPVTVREGDAPEAAVWTFDASRPSDELQDLRPRPAQRKEGPAVNLGETQ